MISCYCITFSNDLLYMLITPRVNKLFHHFSLLKFIYFEQLNSYKRARFFLEFKFKFSYTRTDVKIWIQRLWQRYRKFSVQFEKSVNFSTVLLHSIYMLFCLHRLVIKKHCMCGHCIPKQHFSAIVCNSKSHAIILWHLISIKLNIGKKITGLEIMTLSCKQNLACFQTYRTDV